MSDETWLKALLLWEDLPKRKSTLDVEDAEKIPFTSVTKGVRVVAIQTRKLESTLGSNGIRRCKKLPLF